jgi:hypothetical protein
MIHVFFVPGMFGSTIEFVLRSYTKEYDKLDAQILDDGSMHSFKKQAHEFTIQNIKGKIQSFAPDVITTPIYPFANAHFPEILAKFDQHSTTSDSFVLVYANSPEAAEINLLFQYHKIANGVDLQQGLEIFCGNNAHNIKNWNKTYTHWAQMQQWELREWFSLFYVDWCKEWQTSQYQISCKFLKISNTEILNDPYVAFKKIINHCKLTEQPGLYKFAVSWREYQQYIVNEYKLISEIVYHSINDKLLSWQPINVIAEAIVQQKLRAMGYEIRCNGLNIFPTDSKTLYNLLEKV